MNDSKSYQLSIIVPTLNEERYIGVLLDSLLVQTSKSFEVIVVDGDSSDGTREVVQRFVDRLNMRFVQAERGIANQRNYGASLAHADRLLFLDADVRLDDRAVERVIKLDVGRSYYLPLLMPDSRNALDVCFMLGSYVLFSLARIIKKPILVGSAIISSKRLHEEINGFDPGVSLGEDMDYAFRATKNGWRYKFALGVKVYVSVRRAESIGRIKLMLIWGEWYWIAITKSPRAIRRKDYWFGKH